MGFSDDGRAEEAPGQEGVSVLHFLPILFYLQTSCCFASPLPDLLEPCQLPADLAELEVRVLEQSCFPTVPVKPPCPPRPARPRQPTSLCSFWRASPWPSGRGETGAGGDEAGEVGRGLTKETPTP